MNYRHLIAGILLLLSVSLDTVKAQDQDQSVPVDAAVKTGKLPNGFTYYIRKNNEPEKRVFFYLVNKVGSVLEDDDQKGLAHFMEHMNFNGTTHFPKNKLIDYLQKVGVRFGADLNAYTSYNETVYQLPIPTDNPVLVMKGLDIMRDWAKGTLLETEDINNERGIILEEKRLTEGVRQRLHEKALPLILNNSRYSHRLPIGIDSILVNFHPDVLRRFYHDWYRPNLQALIVVGDVDVEQMEKQIRKQFSDLKNPDNERVRPDYKTALTGRNQFLLLTDPEVTTTELKILMKHPGIKMKTTADYLKVIKGDFFNQMLSYRLNEASQQPNAPFLSVNADIDNLAGGLMQFEYSVTAKPQMLQEAFNSTWSLLEQVKQLGFTQAELDRVKTSYMKGWEQRSYQKSKTPSSNYVSAYQDLFLNGSSAPGFDWEYNFVKKVLPGITLEDVKAVAREYIAEVNRDVFVVAPEKEKANLPNSATVDAWLTKVKSSSFAQYKYSGTDEVLLDELPNGGKIITSTHIPELGVQQLTLSNGVKIWLRPTTFKNNQIKFISFAPGGINKYTNEDYPSASNAAGIIGGSGVGAYSPNQLSKMLNGKSASVVAYIGGRSQGITGVSSTDDLETALQMIYLRYTAPRKDTASFGNDIVRFREEIRNRYDDPENVFQDTVSNVLSGYNYRMSPVTLERLDSVNLEKAFEIYKDRFADAGDACFIFVGDFKIDSISPLLERYLGSLPALNLHEKPIDLLVNVPKGKLTKIVEKGQSNKATVVLVYNGHCKFNENEARQLQALSEVLQYRLLTSLREKAGEVYTPSVEAVMLRKPDQRFSITVSFGCAPEHVDHLVGLVHQDISALQKNGATGDELKKYKEGVRKQVELYKKSNDFWLSYIAGMVERKEKLSAPADLEKHLSLITTNSISNASKTYLSGENCIRFVSLPNKK